MSANETSHLCSFRTVQYISVLEEFLNCREFRLYVAIPAVLLAPVITCGNGVVLVAILRCRSLQSPAAILIRCLLCADCLIGLVFLPLYAAWTLSDYAMHSCTVTGILLFSGWFVSTISFMTIIAVSCDRYIALFYPFDYQNIVTTTRILKVIFCIWIFSATQSTLSLFRRFVLVRYILMGVLLTIGLTVLVFTYTRIFRLVRHHHRQINSRQMTNGSAPQRKLAVTMAYVIGVTCICYTPFGTSLVIVVAQGNQFSKISLQYFHLSELFFCVSSLCNPMIYCMRNLEIRGAVCSLLRGIKSNVFRRKREAQQHSESTAPATITPKRITEEKQIHIAAHDVSIALDEM